MTRTRGTVADPLEEAEVEAFEEAQAGPPDPDIDFDALNAELEAREAAAREAALVALASTSLDKPESVVIVRGPKYFQNQEKEVIVVMLNEYELGLDPEKRGECTVPVSINGYQLDIKKGVPTMVPKDFADYLVWIGAAYRLADAVIAQPSAPFGQR